MKNHLSIALAFMLLAISSSAQPQGVRPAPPDMKTPAEMAKEQADRMQSELSLDRKQYKKVYRLFKKDCEYRRQARENGFPAGMPPRQGGPGGGGPGGVMMGGGPGMNGAMMGGGSGMPGGGMPAGQGGMRPDGRPEAGPGMGPVDEVVTEEYLERLDDKLRKILSAGQYDRWRAKHPAEHLDLPPMRTM